MNSSEIHISLLLYLTFGKFNRVAGLKVRTINNTSEINLLKYFLCERNLFELNNRHTYALNKYKCVTNMK